MENGGANLLLCLPFHATMAKDDSLGAAHPTMAVESSTNGEQGIHDFRAVWSRLSDSDSARIGTATCTWCQTCPHTRPVLASNATAIDAQNIPKYALLLSTTSKRSSIDLETKQSTALIKTGWDQGKAYHWDRRRLLVHLG
jgi:hypothetical protein